MPPPTACTALKVVAVPGTATKPIADWIKPLPTAIPGEPGPAASTLRNLPALFQVKFADPPNTAALLNCTFVSAPPGVPPPPPPQAPVQSMFVTWRVPNLPSPELPRFVPPVDKISP